MGPECQGSTGAADGENEICQHSDERGNGPPLANRPSSPAYPKRPGAFLDEPGFFQDDCQPDGRGLPHSHSKGIFLKSLTDQFSPSDNTPPTQRLETSDCVDTSVLPTLRCMSRLKKITVLLADDHAVVRLGLSKLLEAEGRIRVVG